MPQSSSFTSTAFADGGSSPPGATSSTQPGSPGRKTLHLGVVVQPYRSKSRKATGLTTGDIAEFLESKYGVMGAFYRAHKKDIAKAMENSTQGALEALIMGRKIVDPYGRGMQEIQTRFKDFINLKEIEGLGIPGVPTHAALMGYSQRRAHPYARGPRRPSFRDSGMYVGSFRSWVSTG
jgi:hypothetical protein